MKRLLVRYNYVQPCKRLCRVCEDALNVMIEHDLVVVVDVPQGEDFTLNSDHHHYEVCTVRWNPAWRDWRLGVHWLCGWSAGLLLSMDLDRVRSAILPKDLRDFEENLVMLALAGEP